MQAKSPLHLAALRFAAAGIPVFPCIADAKKPACENGFHDATTDAASINGWWYSNPNYNVAFSPQDVGLGIVDLDGPEADAAWAELKQTHDIPDTREVLTPRGGRHVYFQGELPQTAWAPNNKRCLGVHIDTRGIGSYALLPPSIVDGKPYKVLHDRPIACVPDWMPIALRKRDDERKSVVADLDTQASKDRGRALLLALVQRGDVAVTGRGGNNRTYQLACELSDLGLSPEFSGELLEEVWNPHCQPPWSSEELATIISNAAAYVQNESGAYAVAPAAEVFQGNLDRLLPDEKTNEPVRSRFYAEDDEEQDNAPDPVWLIPDLVPDASTILVLGAKGSFKSFITQEILMAIAANVPTFGHAPVRSGPTFYGAHEGRNAIKKPRKNAWKLAHGLEDKKLPFYVMRAPMVKDPGQCDEFREQIRVRLRQGRDKIGGIVLDTVAKCMVGLNENDAGDCGLFSAFTDSLRDEFECPVIALHHYGKDAARGGRGSSALPANFDTVITVERHEKSLHLTVKVDYHKDAPEPENAYLFEGAQLGPSLVFSPISEEAHRAATMAEQALDNKKVGAALKALNAFGMDGAVTTNVLAGQLTPQHEGEELEAHQRRVNETARTLVKLARLKLAAYVEKSGRDLMWLLPTKD